jgi:hypothetical protein
MRLKMKSLFVLFIVFSLSSCGIKSYRTFGDANEVELIFNDLGVKCEFAQVIYDHSFGFEIGLNFAPTQRNDSVEIIGIDVNVRQEQRGRLEPSPFKVSHINIGLSGNESRADTVENDFSKVPYEFKLLSKIHSLHYNYSFEPEKESAFGIASDVDKLVFDLKVKLKVEGENREYKKTISLKADSHHYFWFLRDC